MSATSLVRVTVQVSGSHDGIIVTPTHAEDLHGLRRELSRVGASARRAGVGLALSGRDVAAAFELRDGYEIRWLGGAERFADNRRRAFGGHEQALAALRLALVGDRATGVRRLGDAERLSPLDDHQIRNVVAMTLPDSPGLCLFDEQGTGKTVAVVFAYDVLVHRNEIDFALVVAPKSMIGEWQNDFERFTGRLYRVETLAGGRMGARQAVSCQADVLVTNYESTISLERELSALLRRRKRRAILVVDESFFAKNAEAQRTRAIKRLREECGRAFVLCGTPAPNEARDVIEQVSLVDFGVAFTRVRLPKDRRKAVEVIRRTVEAKGLVVRHLKSAVLPDLPERRFTRVPISLEPLQQRAYKAALTKLLVDVRSVDETLFRKQLTSYFAQRTALLQLCSAPGVLLHDYSELPAKLKALDLLLPELIETRQEKVVLWSFYTHSVDAIASRFKRFGVARYDGTVSDVAERRQLVRRFQEDDETRLFVGNPAAAGAGLTLHRARIAIYESLSNQAAHYLQSLDRIHRRGQAHEVEYVFLVCQGTIEEQEYRRLFEKEAAAKDLLGDPAESRITRELFLADLVELQSLLPLI